MANNPKFPDRVWVAFAADGIVVGASEHRVAQAVSHAGVQFRGAYVRERGDSCTAQLAAAEAEVARLREFANPLAKLSCWSERDGSGPCRAGETSLLRPCIPCRARAALAEPRTEEASNG